MDVVREEDDDANEAEEGGQSEETLAQRIKRGGGAAAQWRGWQAVSEKPLMCRMEVESEHPYRASSDTYGLTNRIGYDEHDLF